MYHRYRKDTWRTIAPAALASVLTLALGLTGQALQLFHVLALMLLLGIGVDYGIFMQEQNRQAQGKASLISHLIWLGWQLGFPPRVPYCLLDCWG